MKKFTQKGFAHLSLLLLLAVIVAVAVVGYKVVKDRQTPATTTANTTIPATSVGALPVIKNTADLNTVESTLNSQNIDGDLNPDSMNQDVQSLL